ncbi:nicotinate-nucleotide adenylyltransferase [Aestuariibaculum suncheonense]|uniref:Nicotinate-nucleotide adenylyltransferase n=1 Tax=Aestuariibaculum suncheonense TaxID=1028745 RepID=A0A8J6UH67_9FLAO|nr:nicotinate-nucleotide adenylyltransferase [Aestuariibaculum suncheonense]MBD0835589.1 nicotinate-nucleotide adenylyltransferase [Aestuariibaculum suncheonense]
MKNIIIGLFILGLTTSIYAQVPIQLPEVVIVHNYKYLDATGSRDLAIDVEKLELKVSDFNVKDLDIYSEDNEYYEVFFIIPKGKILATYDHESTLLRTAERFKNIDLPEDVKQAVAERFPQWKLSKNVYLVNYYEPDNIKKLYKITLENGDKHIRVKIDDHGDFM